MPILDDDDYNNGTVLAIDGADEDDSDDQGISYVHEKIQVTNARTGMSLDQADYVAINNVSEYTNKVSNNDRKPSDDDKMYTGDLTED